MSSLMYASHSWSGYLNVEYVSTIQKLFTKSVKWGVSSKRYQAASWFVIILALALLRYSYVV